MPFAIPSLAQLIDESQGDIESRIDGADARLRRNVLSVLARVHADAKKNLYGYLGWQAQQLFPQTAEMPYLAWLGSLKGVFQKQPTAANFTVSFTGNNGVDISAGTTLQRSDGAQFTTQADEVIANGTASATVAASVPGSAGNTAPNSQLTFVRQIAGVQSTATVGASVATGADLESVEAYRGRVIFRWQNPPAGGRPADYVAWATSIAGVTRAWPFPAWMGNGTIGVTFVLDDNPVSIIPQAADIQAVTNYIVGTAANAYNDGVKPVTAQVYVFAPTAVPFNPTIHLNPSNATTQAAVWAQIADLIAREAVPGGSIYLSHFQEAIETAAGVVDSTLVSPVTASVTMSAGQLLVPGAPTWQ